MAVQHSRLHPDHNIVATYVRPRTHACTCLQAREQVSDVQWREDEIRSVVTQLHDEVVALSAAHAALSDQYTTPDLRALDAAVVRMLARGGGLEREVLINVYRPRGAPALPASHHGTMQMLSCLLALQ